MPAGPPPVSVHYSRHVGWAGAILAEFVAQGPSAATVSFNYDDRPMIGEWRSTLSDKTYRRLLSDMRRTRYARRATGNDFPPDTKFITFGVRAAGDSLPTLSVFDVNALPVAIDHLAREFEQAIDEIRREPMRVLAGKACFTSTTIDAWTPLSVTLTLENVGPLPAALGNPLAVAASESTGIQLYLRTTASPQDEHSVEIERLQLRAAPGTSTAPLVTLDPTEQLTIEVHKRVYLAPGTYTGALSFQNLADDAADPQVVEGALWIELGKLTVTRPSSLR